MVLLLLLLELLLLNNLEVVINCGIEASSTNGKVIVAIVEVSIIEIVIIRDQDEISTFLRYVLMMVMDTAHHSEQIDLLIE